MFFFVCLYAIFISYFLQELRTAREKELANIKKALEEDTSSHEQVMAAHMGQYSLFTLLK